MQGLSASNLRRRRAGDGAAQKYPRCPPDDPLMKGHGTKFGRKKEATIAALLAARNHEEAATSAGISLKTLKRWLRIPEFLEEYRRTRWEVAEQGYARAQQNTGLAVAVLLKLMAAESTRHPVASGRRWGVLTSHVPDWISRLRLGCRRWSARRRKPKTNGDMWRYQATIRKEMD